MPMCDPLNPLIDAGNLGMTGDIPKDIEPEILREIPKQDDATHVSLSVENGKPKVKVSGTW